MGCIGSGSVLAEVPQCRSVMTEPAVQEIANGMQVMSADAAELSFMQSMISLDLGVIGMSKQADSKATHEELRQFARRVVDERYTEQDRLLTWILTLYGDGVYNATKLFWYQMTQEKPLAKAENAPIKRRAVRRLNSCPTSRLTKLRVHSRLREWAFDFYKDFLLVGVHDNSSDKRPKKDSRDITFSAYIQPTEVSVCRYPAGNPDL